ncbi:hypothetical protein DFJ74DRAFT_771340 [Hyaloraphidium curvatum]|nr:hypothetical protein DFJ74DRAFT_771340 [Hyaloraphidium curvatum]
MSADHGFPPPALADLVDRLAALLVRRKETVSVAESACGGIISAAILAFPGASAFYKGGSVIYTMDAREQFADFGIREMKSRRWGAGQMAIELGERSRKKLGAHWTIVELGIAGPGTSKNSPNPAGYCEFAVVYSAVGTKGAQKAGLSPKPTLTAHKTVRTGRTERGWNMVEFARVALEMLLEKVEEVDGKEARGEMGGSGLKVKL